MLVFIGWINIYSATITEEQFDLINFTTEYGKQLIWIGLSFPIILLILLFDAKFYEKYASLIYLISLISLAGLFVFGKNINGATSWYAIGNMTLQPSEFAKFATSLAIAKYISDIQTNIKTIKHQIRVICILLLPAFLILLQNDAGSTIVYSAFFFVFYREGLQQIYLIIGVIIIVLSVLTLKFGVVITLLATIVCIFIYHFYKKRKRTPLLEYITVYFVLYFPLV